jgi:transcription antitermination factor NusA-like protein
MIPCYLEKPLVSCLAGPSPGSSYSNKMASLDLSPSDSPNVTLTIRLIMQGKEVGSIIGKKGDIVKRFREESGAKINISDGSCPERIVTVTGNTESIFKAFTLICNKFEEDLNNLISPGTVPRPPITFRLVVPASQCGSLIGKGGSKIKEIREITGASIQVASEMLPNSTERAVTISGGSEAVIQCIFHICTIMSESPPKGVTVPYTPLKAVNVGGGVHSLPAFFQQSQAVLPHNPTSAVQQQQIGKMGLHINTMNGNPLGTNLLNPAALALLTGQGRGANTQQTHEMTVPNELIGCIIGKGGSKVAEIRQLSGAMIRISNCEDRDAPANLDRTISITGNNESVALAQYLINMRISMETASMGGMAGFAYISPNHIVKTSQ